MNKSKLIERTPSELRCSEGCCPAIYEKTSKKGAEYLVIGKVVDAKKWGLNKKVGKDEILVSIPKDLIDKKI